MSALRLSSRGRRGGVRRAGRRSLPRFRGAGKVGYARASVDDFGAALSAVRDLKSEGVVSEYAIGGAMALVFWSEPAATYDLDIFVVLQQEGILVSVSLAPIYEWARQRGYPSEAEHIVISGIPVQFIPAHNELANEAVASAADLNYEDQLVRVITPEYLVALYLEPTARTRKRLERVGALLDEGVVDREKLENVLTRYKLELPKT